MLRVKTLTITLVILICFTSLAKAEERKKIEYYPVDDVKFLWGEEQHTELHKALQKAKESIYVVMFNLRASGREHHPVDILLQDLIDAHRREVQIEVILEDSLRTNNQTAYNLLSQNGIKVQFDSRKTLTHTKLVMIDNYLTFVGSGNWTYASFRINTDSTVMIKSEKIAQSFMPHIEAIATEAGISGSAPVEAGPSPMVGGKLNINLASQKDLEELPGIGPVLAQRIIEHRKEHGPFSRIDDIQDIPRIGEKTFEELKDRVTVEEPPAVVPTTKKKAILETLAPAKEPDAKIFLQMADNYYTNKMYDRALEEYQKVIAKFPNSPEAEEAKAMIREIQAQ